MHHQNTPCKQNSEISAQLVPLSLSRVFCGVWVGDFFVTSVTGFTMFFRMD